MKFVWKYLNVTFIKHAILSHIGVHGYKLLVHDYNVLLRNPTQCVVRHALDRFNSENEHNLTA